MSAPVKVKRDGPRGWHWIAAENYDPCIHELVGDDAPAPAEPDAPAESVPELPPASAEKPVPRAKKPRRKKGAK